MYYEVCFSNSEGKQYFGFANTATLLSVVDWINSLPNPPFSKLAEFAKKLSIKNTTEFSAELELALERFAPSSPGTLQALQQLAKNVGVGNEKETMYINDE